MGRAKRRKLAARGSSAPAHADDRHGGRAGDAPPPLRVNRPDAAALAAAVLGPLSLYAATLPRTVVLEDDGLFLMAGVHLGVAHPPGYPLYTLIVHLFTRLPFGDAAFLGHLSSAVLGALACGAVYACARLLRASPVPALTAAWLFGVSEQFWSQAIITDVYTLNALLFFGVYALVLLGARDPWRGWPLWCAAVAWGASLANHWPLTVLATPGLALALAPAWREVLPRLPRLLGAALAAAALPYAWMVWLSHQGPAISFFGPIDGWGEFWSFVSRQSYSAVDVSPSAGWGDRAGYLGWFTADLVRQTTLPGAVLAAIGLSVLARAPGGRRGATASGSGVLAGAAAAGSGVLALLGNSVALIALLGFDFDPFWLAVFRPYPLICYGVAALWVGAGLEWAIGRLPGGSAPPVDAAGDLQTGSAVVGGRGNPGACRGAAALASLTMVAWSAGAGWAANDRSGSDFAQRHAEVVFDLLPPGAALFVSGDELAPFGYYRYVDERRSDVSLYSLEGLVFDNRLFDPLVAPAEKQRALDRSLDRYVSSTDQAVFLSANSNLSASLYLDVIVPGRGLRYYGFVVEILGEDTEGTVELTRDERGERYFLELLDLRPADRWEQWKRALLLSNYGAYLGFAVLGPPLVIESMAPLIERAEGCYPCLLGMSAAVLRSNEAADHTDRIAGWLARAEALRDQAMTKQASAKVFFEQGRLAELTGDADTAAARYRQAYGVHPHPEGDAGAALRRLGLAP